MKTNQQFKNEALAALRGNWGKAVLLTLVYLILVGIAAGPVSYQSVQMETYMQENGARTVYQMASLMQDPEYLAMAQRLNGTSGLTTLVSILLIYPFSVGFLNSLRKLLVTGDNNLVPNAFHIAFSNYWHKVWAMLWAYILTVLWSLLFIIPGIIKSFSYAMTPFIIEEYPELTATEAIHRSRMMMRGHKFDLFWLLLSFIGWGILNIFTLGIGTLWLVPYMETSMAAFYGEVKNDYELNGGLD
ncbi:MAG: DUF975 family protein [Bacteroidales bacterium]|nr:DUF975 family protein [Bacteroidales bacterium]